VVVDASQDNRGHGERAREPRARRTSAVVWHDLECGSYTADLPLWRELAGAADMATRTRPVLDVGAGTGRVALDLAGRGHPVTALDLDAELLEALRERAAGMHVQTVCADARTFALARRDFAVCLAPMQTVQMLEGAAGRLQFLRRARAHLAPGGLLACAIVTEIEPFDCAAGDLGPSPEIARVDGAHYVSRATRVRAGRHVVRIERERSILAAEQTAASARAQREGDGVQWERDVVELDRVGVARLQREGREAGLTAAGTRPIPATEEHTGSVAVMFRA
jgi:SAM-dependent methyltransferase